MKKWCDATLISALGMSLCLVGLIPGSLRFASTWKELYLYGIPDKGVQNLLMPLGFYSLGLELIGLVVLWTGFRRKERWAWFVMLIILLFFIFPPHVLTLIVKTHEWNLGFGDYSQLVRYALKGDKQSMGMVLGALTFVVMLVALLLPLRTFFWNVTNLKVSGD